MRALLVLFAIIFASPVTFSDIRERCSSEATDYCQHPNNRNSFNTGKIDRREFEESGGCQRNKRCPGNMKLVCSEALATKVCMDADLKTAPSGQPQGLMTFHTCEQYCAGRGFRIPTNNEWMLAASGTDPETCLPAKTIERYIHPQKPTPPANQSYNDRYIRTPRNACVSNAGIRDMVGVLGQWVTDGLSSGQFNGGYWAFAPSSVHYTTTAHGRGYTDYSIGCRCASNAH